jgi:asparagine synthase (glutamine-hydrolysing)
VAAHLKTDHHELYLAPRAARDLIPDLPDWYDEPFADSSALPTYLVSRLAREHVTVALSGDGGDEVFFGYNRHRALARLARLDALPQGMRRLAARAIERVGPEGAERFARLLPESRRPRQIDDKAAKLARALAGADTTHRYLDLVSHWRPEDGMVADLPADELLPGGLPPSLDAAERAAACDTLGYLPDDILTKVDRASMAVSLEARVPLLDHRVVEYAWRMPSALKLKDGVGKWPLRQILYRRVPQHLVERPKAGFAIPLGEWLRGPLRDWAGDLLSERRLKERGLVDPARVRAAWADHLTGQGQGRAEALWNVLMLEAWAERWLDR